MVALLSIIAFLFGPLQAQKAQALSCIATQPRIGTLEEVREGPERSLELGLKWVYTFKPTRINEGEGIVIDLDKYKEIVREYIDDDLELFEQASTQEELISWDYNTLVLPPQSSAHMTFESGDIIVEGPPFHLCDYRLRAVFDSEGSLKYSYVEDPYNSYQFQGTEIHFEAGRSIACQGYGCQVQAKISVGSDRVSFEPGETKTFESSLVESITLIDARAPESGIDAERLFPWGGGKMISHIISFNQRPGGSEPGVENTEEEAGEPEDGEENMTTGTLELSEEKSESAFARFWSWLKSLFSGKEKGEDIEGE